MKVVFVSEHYPPDQGGLESSTHRLARELVSRGISLQVIAPFRPNCREYLDGVSVVRPDDPNTKLTHHHRAETLLLEADVIVIFGIEDADWDLLWPPIFGGTKGKKLLKIGSSGDIAFERFPISWLRQFDGILCQNESIMREVHQCSHEIRTFPVINGLDVPGWQLASPGRIEARSRLRIDANAYTILALGRFVEKKRFPSIILEYERFAQKSDVHSQLLLHGDDFGKWDGEASLVRQMVADRGELNVKIVTPDIEPFWSFAAADVFVAMGTREGATNTVLEALASGIPTVASNIDGHTLYLTHGREGLICADPVEENMAEHFVALVDRQLRIDMGRNALLRAMDFDIGRAADMYIDAFVAVS